MKTVVCALVGLVSATSLAAASELRFTEPSSHALLLPLGGQVDLRLEYHGDPWDQFRGAMMFTNLGAPVHFLSVEVNGRPECTMKLYAATPGAEQRVGFWLTDAEFQRFNDLSPIDLTLRQGDQFVTFVPSVVPIPGLNVPVRCGMQLVHLELTTDDGVLTWDIGKARRQGGGGNQDDGSGEGD